MAEELSTYKIVAGLGNPGPSYAGTRHNLGFILLDEIVGSSTSWKAHGDLLVAEVRVAHMVVAFAKPMSFMNRSGEPLGAYMRFKKLTPQELIVVHDELDLPLGTVRGKHDGGEGGHNGLRSISQCLGSAGYTRLRLGIGRPPQCGTHMRDTTSWVLGKFTSEERVIVAEMLSRASHALSLLVEKGLKEMQRIIHPT